MLFDLSSIHLVECMLVDPLSYLLVLVSLDEQGVKVLHFLGVCHLLEWYVWLGDYLW